MLPLCRSIGRLGALGLFGQFVRLPDEVDVELLRFFFGAPPLGHGREQDQARQSHHAHIRLQQQEGFIGRGHRERSLSMHRPPDCDARQPGNAQCDNPLIETQSRPNQAGKHEKSERVAAVLKPLTKNHQTRDRQREEHEQRLAQPPGVAARGGQHPRQQQRREHQHSRQIPQPPRQPHSARHRPARHPRRVQAGHAKRRTDHAHRFRKGFGESKKPRQCLSDDSHDCRHGGLFQLREVAEARQHG